MNNRTLVFKLIFSFLLGVSFFPVVAHAQQATSGEPLISNGDFVDAIQGWKLSGGKLNPPVPFAAGNALGVETSPARGEKPTSIQLRQGVLKALLPGETLRLRFRARVDVPVKFGATLEKNLAPFDAIVQTEVELTPSWQAFEASGKTAHDFSANTTTLSFNLGYGAAKIELADIHLEAIERKSQLQAQPQNAPVDLIANGDWSAPLEGNWAVTGVKTEIVPAQIAGYKQALHVSAAAPQGANPWDFQINQVVKAAVPRESAVYFRAYLRAPNGPAKARIGMVYEKTGAPNTKVIAQTLKLTPNWQEFRFMEMTPELLDAGQSRVGFFVGFPANSRVEIAGVRLENYGRAPRSRFSETPQPIDYWNDAPHDDIWKAAALQRIERIRKADFSVRVVDNLGKAVPNAQVKIEMTRHAFRWGVAGKARRLIDTKNADNLRFQAEVKRLYNTFTFENDLKWTEKTPDLERLRAVDMALGWLHANNFEVGGHNFVWGARKYLPAEVLDLPAPELTELIKTRVQSFARRYRGQVYVWDGVNEAADNVALWDKIGWDSFANVYKWAREADPDVLLAYNDYNITNQAGDRGHRAKVLARVKVIVDAGAPLDIIGDQAHMAPPLQPIPKFLSDLDEVAATGKAIEITEFDLSVKDDKIHGDYVRDILIAAFSHPKVAGFTQWGMWEGDHWLAEKGGAMFRTDWSKRPAQIAYEDLVLRQWWTHAAGKTDGLGNYRTRGFLGNYDVNASAGGKSASVQAKLTADGQNLTLILP